MKHYNHPKTNKDYQVIANDIYDLTHDTWENWVETDYVIGIYPQQIIIYTGRDVIKSADLKRLISVDFLLNDAGPNDYIDELMEGEYNRDDDINDIINAFKKLIKACEND